MGSITGRHGQWLLINTTMAGLRPLQAVDLMESKSMVTAKFMWAEMESKKLRDYLGFK